jgi:hypothetical protein
VQLFAIARPSTDRVLPAVRVGLASVEQAVEKVGVRALWAAVKQLREGTHRRPLMIGHILAARAAPGTAVGQRRWARAGTNDVTLWFLMSSAPTLRVPLWAWGLR